MDLVFDRLVCWFAPIMVFTCEEALEARRPGGPSVHLRQFPETPASWSDPDLALRWERIFTVRRAVTAALEVERRERRIGSSLEASVRVTIPDPDMLSAFSGEDAADIFITSGASLEAGPAPEGSAASVHAVRAEGVKCARSWKYFDPSQADPEFPDITPRDARAVREVRARRRGDS